jgi:hypothetical protein
VQGDIQTVMVVGAAAGTFMYGISLFIAIVNKHQAKANRQTLVSEPIMIEAPEELGIYQARSSMVQTDL